ncbi:MAG TPA: TonB-dependent receptor [Thermodesulfobacteriota bacterium]
MHRRQGRIALVAAAVAAIVAAAAAGRAVAGEAGGTSVGEEGAVLPPVVVSATRVEQPLEEVGSAVTVISGEELRRRGIDFVADALEEVPGLSTPRSGTRGKTTSIHIRGADSEQTLVLVDGVRMNPSVGGRFDLGAFRTDNVERIEVIRGPQSVLYGSDAIGGVVNIITRGGRGPLSAAASAAGGNYDTYEVSAGLAGGGSRLGGSLEVSRFSTDNRFPNDDFDVNTASGRLDGRVGERLTLGLTVRASDAETGLPGQVRIAPNLVDRQEDEVLVVGASAELQTTERWRQRLALGYNDQELRFRSAFGTAVTETDLRSVEWVHTVELPWSLTWLVGGEYRAEDGKAAGVDSTLYTRAAFTQLQATAFDDRLFLTAGTRLDDGTQFDTEVSPKVSGALLVPETGTRLHASWGEGIRGPTLVDLFFPGFDDGSGTLLFPGNPDLEPERSTGWDVGVEQRVGAATADVTFFRNDFRDLIVLEQTAPFAPVNLGRAHSYGVESTLGVRPARWIDLEARYTYLVARDDETGDLLLRRPRNQASVAATVRPLRHASATASVLYVGERRDNTFEVGSTPRTFGGYTRVDLSARYRIPELAGFRAVELFGRVENLLDREYEEVAGFPALGINVLAGVRGTF